MQTIKTQLFWANLSSGAVIRIEAKNRKDAIKKAKATGYEVYKLTKDGGILQYHLRTS